MVADVIWAGGVVPLLIVPVRAAPTAPALPPLLGAPASAAPAAAAAWDCRQLVVILRYATAGSTIASTVYRDYHIMARG